MGIGTSELLLILVVVLVIFGGGKIPEVGRALGEGIRNFKEGMRDASEKPKDDDRHESKS